jgi:hypothetical protein
MPSVYWEARSAPRAWPNQPPISKGFETTIRRLLSDPPQFGEPTPSDHQRGARIAYSSFR